MDQQQMFPQSFLNIFKWGSPSNNQEYYVTMLPCYYITKLTKYVLLRVKIKWRKTFLSYLPRHKGLMCWHENQENTRNATSYGDVGRESPAVIWTSLCHPISNDAWRGSDLKNPKFEGYKEIFPKKRKTFKWIPPYHMSHSHIILNSPLSLIQIPPMPLSFQDLISLDVYSLSCKDCLPRHCQWRKRAETWYLMQPIRCQWGHWSGNTSWSNWRHSWTSKCSNTQHQFPSHEILHPRWSMKIQMLAELILIYFDTAKFWFLSDTYCHQSDPHSRGVVSLSHWRCFLRMG